MKNFTKYLIAAVSCVALLSGAWAQQQGAQTLSTTTLGAAVTTTYGTQINLASLTNVTATASVQTVLWVDTEAMTVATNTIPASGTTVTVTRGSLGTKAETHASGRTVYVSRPNLFQNYDVAGTCTSGTGLASVLPWINLDNGKRFNCYTGGEWFLEGSGSGTANAIAVASAFCTTTLTSGATAYLNGTACASSSTATFRYTVTTPGELANLRVFSSASETAAAGDPVTVYKNGSATTITCTILQNAATCSDSTHSVAVVAGDTLTFNVTGATSAAAANLSASVGIYNQ